MVSDDCNNSQLIWLARLGWSNVSLQRDSWSTSMIKCCSPARLSAYHHFHSTEMANAVIHNDHIRAADVNQNTALMLLGLSSAFDTVEHDILLSVLEKRFGVDGVAQWWFQSYLQVWSQTYMVNEKSSRTHRVDCSVPQGSCLEPVEFIT